MYPNDIANTTWLLEGWNDDLSCKYRCKLEVTLNPNDFSKRNFTFSQPDSPITNCSPTGYLPPNMTGTYSGSSSGQVNVSVNSAGQEFICGIVLEDPNTGNYSLSGQHKKNGGQQHFATLIAVSSGPG